MLHFYDSTSLTVAPSTSMSHGLKARERGRKLGLERPSTKATKLVDEKQKSDAEEED